MHFLLIGMPSHRLQGTISTSILAVGIYKKKKKVHLLTRNVQITAYKQINTWYDLSGPQLQRPSFWASNGKKIQVVESCGWTQIEDLEK